MNIELKESKLLKILQLTKAKKQLVADKEDQNKEDKELLGVDKMEKYEVNKLITEYEQRLDDLEKAIELDSLKQELKSLNDKMLDPSFWNDQNKAKETTRRISFIESNLNTYKSLSDSLSNSKDWWEISEEGTEEWDILIMDLETFSEQIEEFSVQTLL